jgi:hypothetical protein
MYASLTEGYKFLIGSLTFLMVVPAWLFFFMGLWWVAVPQVLIVVFFLWRLIVTYPTATEKIHQHNLAWLEQHRSNADNERLSLAFAASYIAYVRLFPLLIILLSFIIGITVCFDVWTGTELLVGAPLLALYYTTVVHRRKVKRIFPYGSSLSSYIQKHHPLLSLPAVRRVSYTSTP